MAEVESTQTTLRDTIEQAVEQHAPDTAPVETTPSVESKDSAPSSATPVERARDEKTGQFVKSEEKPAAKAAATQAAPAEAPKFDKPRLSRPSSWKKDYEPHWEKLTSGQSLSAEEAYALAQYTLAREGDYAKGVSTYKTEWENAKPVLEALNPFSSDIKALGIPPAQFVTNLAGAHQTLSRGSPEQKLSMFMKLAADYGVPVQNLFVRGQDGQMYFNPQIQSYQAPAARSAAPQVDVAKQVRDEIAAVMGQQQIEQFARETDTAGNPAYPHFESLRARMALLLDAGEARDLKDAYGKALRLDDELFKSEQEKKTKADEAARLEAQRKATAHAKANAVSTKTATPSAAPANGKKGLRATIEDAVEVHAGAGRV